MSDYQEVEVAFYLEDEEGLEIEVIVTANVRASREVYVLDVTVDDFEIIESSEPLTPEQEAKVLAMAEAYEYWAEDAQTAYDDEYSDAMDRKYDEAKDEALLRGED